MKARRSMIVIALLVITGLLAGCANDKRLSELENTQKDILTKLSAIQENQEKILKFFQPKKRPPQEDFSKVHDIPLGDSPVRGGMSAPVTIVEFSDFQCPYCARLQPTLKQVLDAYPKEVRLVYKQFPLSFHPQARNASKAALAAGEQGKFWEMHDIVFANHNKLSEEKFKEFAAKIGLNAAKFDADYKSNKYDKQIQDEITLGNTVGVRGTPSLYLNGKKMAGRSLNDFKTAIDSALKK
ncbi:MAG TPA: hypothetical protein ENH31_02850 [Nitrospirae bacterium]|nr:thiol:disulfide interchange protein DsbA precursor [bacterium BMS3Abin10]GBE39877.1 thiol:disulfide interchange protein DsbA precursor [bacterium BMS3Bbin08]HDH50840.1 hypothetical protein [Nitrospirota bacterium]HDK81491.1 hypothetical protein [Nitrospirota bacterium]